MRLAFALFSLVVVVGCADDEKFRHIPDAPTHDATAVDTFGDEELTVTLAGNGSGEVTSHPDGIDCTTATCKGRFAHNSEVELTATSSATSNFAGWSGACSGNQPTCKIDLAQAQTVTATFKLKTYMVTIVKAGAGAGIVSGGGLACGATCSIVVDHGTALSLGAMPANLSVFAGWGGACSGSGTCDVTITHDTEIHANFALDNFTLFVALGGTGAGSVQSNPAGITCGTDCDQTYVANQQVTLTASPATGSTFTGWVGGGCSGTGTCTVTIAAATTVTANFTLNQYALDVTKAGNGAGLVTGGGLSCGSTCSVQLDYNTPVTLAAMPLPGSTFTGWGGACSGTGSCSVTMTAMKSVTATFTLQQFPLAVTKNGTGAGLVSGGPISCGTTCSATLDYNTPVTLTASPSTGSTFAGWGGACSGTGSCSVTMTAMKSVTATFTLQQFSLAVTKTGTGAGLVSGGPISCGTTCSATLDYNTPVTLTASASTGSTFAGWGGACSGTGTCSVTMTAMKSVTATFTLQQFPLAVTKNGTGAGTVSGGPISCGSTCSATLDYNTPVTLTASASTGSTFAGWGGACSGTGTCSVTMTAMKSVTATFTLQQFPLAVTKNGTGAGTVSGGPISCGTTCSATLDYNTPVTLTASPSTGSTFAGWGGACSGTGTCSVTMTAMKSVTATFTLQQFPLAVTKNGTGAGTVSGGPISCGTTCSATLDYNTPLTLTASPATGSTFAGWGGACSGTGTCSVTMTAMKSVTATFTLQQFTVTVTTTGYGTVSGPNISCGADCSEVYTYGTPITLTAAPGTTNATLSTFSGWGGACSGSGTCSLTVTSNLTVGASFNLKPNIMFVTNTAYDGNLAAAGGGDQICQSAATAAGLSGNYLAYLSYGYATVSTFVTVNAPSRFTGASGWVRTDGASVMKTVDQMHLGTLINPPLLTEYGTSVANTQYLYVWTGTWQGVYNDQCSSPNGGSWNGTSNAAWAGKATVTTAQVVSTDTFSCPGLHRLYCLGIDRAATVP